VAVSVSLRAGPSVGVRGPNRGSLCAGFAGGGGGMAATASTRIGASGRSRALVRGVGRYFLGIFEWCLHWKTKGSAARVAGRLRSVSVLFGRSERRTVSHIKKLQANEGFAGGGRIGGSRKRRKQADGRTDRRALLLARSQGRWICGRVRGRSGRSGCACAPPAPRLLISRGAGTGLAAVGAPLRARGSQPEISLNSLAHNGSLFCCRRRAQADGCVFSASNLRTNLKSL